MNVPTNLFMWIMACLPIIVLLVLMIKFQWGVTEAAPAGLVITIVTGIVFYKADIRLLAAESAKGIWNALIIVLIVWTAILMYQVADEAKAFLVIRNGMRKLLPNELLVVLALGWILESFLQGITGFGVPVAVGAPLLIGIGVLPVWAVIIPLLGQSWGNTFGTLAAAWDALSMTAALEPVGVLGARANVDLGNVPVCVSPLEVLDGCIHALTCIGPASKEMSRHYWREPLVLEALHDPEVDLCGVVFVGSPQINAEKFYVSRRVGHTVEMMDADGAFVTTEGFGNNHIDFASHIEQIGMRGIPVVGMSYCAVQGALVVGNKYMTYMVDNNKSEAGIENEILGNNTLCPEDAVRALAMLKTAMAGEDVKAAEKKWNPNVKSTNVELIESAYGTKVDLVENEQALPMSEKRRLKYS